MTDGEVVYLVLSCVVFAVFSLAMVWGQMGSDRGDSARSFRKSDRDEAA